MHSGAIQCYFTLTDQGLKGCCFSLFPFLVFNKVRAIGSKKAEPYLQIPQFIPNGNEPKMQLSPKVISQPPVVVVNTEVRRAHLTHAQLLLLVRRRWHGVTVFLFSYSFLFAKFVNLKNILRIIFGHAIQSC